MSMTNEPDEIVQVMLRGARVTSAFREALFDTSNRAGMTPNEFCLRAAAEKLINSGSEIPGVFRPGDLEVYR